MAARQEKLQKMFQRERESERRPEKKEGADSGVVRVARQEKLKKIFQDFDVNGDGRVDREEMAALIRAVNPRISFTGEQTNAIVDAVFRSYGDLLGRDDQHITEEGLLLTCGDSTADLDRDFDTLGLGLDDDGHTPSDAAAATSTASCVSPTFLSQSPALPPSPTLSAGELDGQSQRLGQKQINGDGASPRPAVARNPPSSLASSLPSPSFCTEAQDSELDHRDRLPPSLELEENGDGASRCSSVAWDRRPSLASSSFCSESEDSELDYRYCHPQSEIEERPSVRWMSPSLLPRPPLTHRLESSEVNWEQLVSADLMSYSGGLFADKSREDVKWTVFGRDESSGKICCLVLARGMNIRWQENRGGCWRYDRATAVLSEVCWLEIGAQVAAADLSAGTDYVCVLVFKLSPGAFGLGLGGETQKTSVYLGPRRVSHRTVQLQPASDWNSRYGAAEPRRRKDGWMEMVLGEFSVGREGGGLFDWVGIELTEVERLTQRKGGLVLRGVELRPDRYACKVLTKVP